jgi:hypothetical protein
MRAVTVADGKAVGSRRVLQALPKNGRATVVDAIPTAMDHADFKRQYIIKPGVRLAAIADFGNGR